MRKKNRITKQIVAKITEKYKTYEKYLKSKVFSGTTDISILEILLRDSLKKAKEATTETISKKILNNEKIFGIKLMDYLKIKANR